MHSTPLRVWQVCAETPFEVMLGASMAILGTVGIISGADTAPASIEQTLPLWLIVAWSLGLAIGGIGLLVGRFTEHTRIESAGLALVAYGNILYSVVLASAASFPSALTSTAVMGSIALAAIMRMRVLALSRKAIDRARRERGE